MIVRAGNRGMRGRSGVAAMSGITLLLTFACTPVESTPSRFGSATSATSATSASSATKSAATTPATPTRATAAPVLFPVAPPPFSDGAFPCSECHSPTDRIDRTPHPVEFHEEIVLQHDEKNRWCLDCHDAVNRDQLHLADGRPVKFTESYRLCGQCHGPTLRNWQRGEHGKRTGSWSGTKQYLLCASCHNPHSPKFKPLAPEPVPVRQELIR